MVSIWVLENLLLKDGTTLQASVIVLVSGTNGMEAQLGRVMLKCGCRIQPPVK